MTNKSSCERELIMDLEMLNRKNAQGCRTCGKKFSLGDVAVLAAGDWGNELRCIHENEAIYSIKTGKHFVHNHPASPVEEPPNEPKRSPVREPEKPTPEPPSPYGPPVKEPPGEPKKPPVKEPPPKEQDRQPPKEPPVSVSSSRNQRRVTVGSWIGPAGT